MVKFSGQTIDSKVAALNREAEERDAKRRAKEEKLTYIDLREQPIDRKALQVVPEELAREAGAVAFDIKGDDVALAAYTSKTSEFEKLKLFLSEKKKIPKVLISSRAGLTEAWKHYASISTDERPEIVSEIRLTDGVVQSKGAVKGVKDAAEDIGQIDAETSTTDALVKILADGLVLNASDVHIEAGRENSLVRFRIDGSLYDVARIDSDIHNRLVGRLKLLAGLKLNIKDEPQDGRFTVKRTEANVEVRLSIVPAEFGEAVVMRLLDPKTISLGLADLGLRQDDEEMVRLAIKQPHGTVLITGPTGSGKTTSLYAFLRENKGPEVKIITIEDPVEYHLDGIEQTQVSPADNYTFATGLRSILRQDPDIILVGEIRDKETATTTIDASLTGHLVFSTLHTNNAPGAIPRLIDLGVKSASLPSALNLVLAQRLVRRLCEKCREQVPIDEDKKIKIKSFYESLPSRVTKPTGQARLYKNKGCESCVGGFKGRVGIFEGLIFDSEFADQLGKEISESTVRRLARDKGMVYMQEDGVIKALQGVTTLEEVERVAGSIKWPEGPVK